MTRAERYEAELAKTAEVLAKPHTAKELADALGITIQGAINRLAALRERGVVLVETPVRINFHGPKAVRYSIAPKGDALEEE